MVVMSGNLNDEGKEKQRAIYLLKAVRAFVGRMLFENPDAEELEELEKDLRTEMNYTVRYEAHSAEEALLAAAITMATYVKNPEEAWAPKFNSGRDIPPALARRLARMLLASVGEEVSV